MQIYDISRFKHPSLKADIDQFMTSHSDGTVKIWNLIGNEVSEDKSFLCNTALIKLVFGQPVTSINSSFDGTKLVASGKDHSALIWCPEYDQEILYSLVGHKDIVVIHLLM